MNWKLAFNDFKNNKLVSFTTAIFIAIATALVCLAVNIVINLSGSIDNLMVKAETPDYLQMHQGELDYKRLENFAKNNHLVDEFQDLHFVNIDRDKIEINGISQKNAVQDNGVVVQSDKFDYLLDLDNQIINVKKGEIYLPLMFYKEKVADVGDSVKIGNKTFKLSGFFRDSQMNSNLAGSKRILLHKDDFEEIKNDGKVEHLIEFKLKDRSKITEFEKSYLENIPEKNGPAVTYSMFKMINSLNDGILVVIILFVSIVVLMISFLSIRFSLMTKIEDEYREIGVMKSIGIDHKSIKKLYVGQYILITVLALIVGYIIALLGQNMVLGDIFLYMGKSDNANIAPIISILALVLLFFIVIGYVNKALNSIKKVSTIEAIQNKKAQEGKVSKMKLGNFANNNRNKFLAFSDVFSRKKMYSSVFLVILFASFLVSLPQFLLSTLKDESFTQNLGLGNINITMDIQADDFNKEDPDNIYKFLDVNPYVDKFESFESKNLLVKLPDEKEAYIKVNLGEHNTFPINYKTGRAPKNDKEIALTSIYLEDLGIKVGDSIKLVENNKELEIVGEYSDVSNGGKTAKANFEMDSGELTKHTTAITVKEKNQINKLIEDISKEFPNAKISSTRKYLDQAFGPMVKQISFASIIAFVATLIVISFICLLFSRLLISKDKQQISILKTVGYTNKELIRQYLFRFGLIMLTAIPLGVLLARTLGEVLSGLMLSGAGLKSIKFVVNPLVSYFIIPFSLILVITLVVRMGSERINSMKISENIKE